jgi:hypothetical protein
MYDFAAFENPLSFQLLRLILGSWLESQTRASSLGRQPRYGREERLMDVKIKLSLAFRVSESALEDAMAEYDELTVEGLIREILDKAVACEDIQAKVEEGPNTLEEYDQLSKS